MRKWMTLLAMMVLVAATSSAEVFVLNSGEAIEGSVARTGTDGRVTLKMKNGVRSYRVSEFSQETRDKYFADLKVIAPTKSAAARKTEARGAGRKESAELTGQKKVVVLGVMIAGLVVIIVGGLWMTIAAFAESPIWGIAFLLSGGVAELAFMFLHWDRARGAVMTQVLGVGLMVAAALFAR